MVLLTLILRQPGPCLLWGSSGYASIRASATSFCACLLSHTYSLTLKDEDLFDSFSLILKITTMPGVGLQPDMVRPLPKILEDFNE